MKTIKSPKSMQLLSRRTGQTGKSIGLVPTMGALHKGHLALVERALKLTDFVVVSIFVNPTQFGAGEDFSRYPRTFSADRKLLAELGVDSVFAPSADQLYPADFETYVAVEKMSQVLEGEFRPTHFRGVTTVVAKLFNIIRPDVAVFGRKDFQQAVVIKKMARDLNFDVKIVTVPTVREKSGLAKSSRNKYFSPEQLRRAVVLYDSLKMAEKMIKAGHRQASKIKSAMKRRIDQTPGTRIDYIAITDEELNELKRLSGKITISLAVWLDEVRLIDNISLNLGK
jgi:pantoate--beta-alanine ligase